MSKSNLECIKNFEPIPKSEFLRVEAIERTIRHYQGQAEYFHREVRRRIKAALAFMTETGMKDGRDSSVNYNVEYDTIGSYGGQSDDLYYVTITSLLDHNHSEDYTIPQELIFANDLGSRYASYLESLETKKIETENEKKEKASQQELAQYLALKKKLIESGALRDGENIPLDGSGKLGTGGEGKSRTGGEGKSGIGGDGSSGTGGGGCDGSQLRHGAGGYPL